MKNPSLNERVRRRRRGAHRGCACRRPRPTPAQSATCCPQSAPRTDQPPRSSSASHCAHIAPTRLYVSCWPPVAFTCDVARASGGFFFISSGNSSITVHSVSPVSNFSLNYFRDVNRYWLLIGFKWIKSFYYYAIQCNVYVDNWDFIHCVLLVYNSEVTIKGLLCFKSLYKLKTFV